MVFSRIVGGILMMSALAIAFPSQTQAKDLSHDEITLKDMVNRIKNLVWQRVSQRLVLNKSFVGSCDPCFWREELI
jgi:hypothetical protein